MKIFKPEAFVYISTRNFKTANGKIKLIGEKRFQIGGQIPYTISDMTGTTIRFKDYGIILQCKPIVDDDEKIAVAVHAEDGQAQYEANRENCGRKNKALQVGDFLRFIILVFVKLHWSSDVCFSFT